MRWHSKAFGHPLEPLKSVVFEISQLLYDIHYQGTQEFELSPLLSGVLNEIESIPEWWKEKYNLPANDERWLSLTQETAYEDYTRHLAKVLLQVLKERYGYKVHDAATIMEKSEEELKDEIRNIQKWIAEDNEVLTEAINKVGSDPEKLEKELYGKVLTKEDKEDMIREKMLEVINEHFGSSNEETKLN